MNPQQELAFKKLEKALMQLDEGIQTPEAQSKLKIDACIQRFEYSIELAWKLLRVILKSKGVVKEYPKDVIRSAYQGNLINDEEGWLEMLDDRNATSHTYDEDLANDIYEHIKERHAPLLNKTFTELAKQFRTS